MLKITVISPENCKYVNTLGMYFKILQRAIQNVGGHAKSLKSIITKIENYDDVPKNHNPEI